MRPNRREGKGGPRGRGLQQLPLLGRELKVLGSGGRSVGRRTGAQGSRQVFQSRAPPGGRLRTDSGGHTERELMAPRPETRWDPSGPRDLGGERLRQAPLRGPEPSSCWRWRCCWVLHPERGRSRNSAPRWGRRPSPPPSPRIFHPPALVTTRRAGPRATPVTSWRRSPPVSGRLGRDGSDPQAARDRPGGEGPGAERLRQRPHPGGARKVRLLRWRVEVVPARGSGKRLAGSDRHRLTPRAGRRGLSSIPSPFADAPRPTQAVAVCPRHQEDLPRSPRHGPRQIDTGANREGRWR